MSELSLLVACGSRPDHVEMLTPVVEEIRRRGWDALYVADNQVTADAVSAAGAPKCSVEVRGGVWDPSYAVLNVPKAGPIFKRFKPDAMLTTVAGHGMPGGAWLCESFVRRVPAVELQSPCACFVWLHSAETRRLTVKYLQALRRTGFGSDHHRLLRRSRAQRWVGFLLGDSLVPYLLWHYLQKGL